MNKNNNLKNYEKAVKDRSGESKNYKSEGNNNTRRSGDCSKGSDNNNSNKNSNKSY